MFLTPKPVRDLIAAQTDRKAHGIMVRIWAAAAFYFIMGVATGILVDESIRLVMS